MKRALLMMLLLAAPAVAAADVAPGPGQCVQVDDGGCSCSTHEQCAPVPDLPFRLHDMSTPRDLTSPPDARRERHRARGRGLIFLSSLSVVAVGALRRRYKISSPTPAEKALAASDTRSDS